MWSRSGTKVTAVVIVVGSALAGCSDMYYDRRDSVSLGAGDAIAANKVTHAIDPWPPYVMNDRIAFNGQRMQSAQDRYKRNQVFTPTLPTASSKDAQVIQQQAAQSQSATNVSTSATPAAAVKGSGANGP
jgi:hypothetical protein